MVYKGLMADKCIKQETLIHESSIHKVFIVHAYFNYPVDNVIGKHCLHFEYRIVIIKLF